MLNFCNSHSNIDSRDYKILLWSDEKSCSGSLFGALTAVGKMAAEILFESSSSLEMQVKS